MKDKDVLAFIPIIIMGVITGFLLALVFYLNEIGKVEKENAELKNENHKLEQKLLKLYEEQAEQTKRTAERNGVGG